MFPADVQYFYGEDHSAKLSLMDAAINGNLTDDGVAYVSSIAEDLDGARADFIKYGFYTKSDFIYKVNIDT